jgi:hypothetical protein
MEASACRRIEGPVVAPLLCNVYVADIPRRPVIEISQFADDTAAFTSNKNMNNLRRYTYDPELLLHKWKIKFNTKSIAVIFTKMRQVPGNRLKYSNKKFHRGQKQNIWADTSKES